MQNQGEETPRTKRGIVRRTRGARRGPVSRLVSPSDLGEVLKPFVFLDLFEIEPTTPARFGLHPHSGIATLTALVEGEMHFSDRHGSPASLRAGGTEWMMAGGGVWHGSALTSPASAKGFQLWVALPPGLEDAPSEEFFLKPDDNPVIGPARVLLGAYQGTAARIAALSAMTYLHVTLSAGERWTFVPPKDHDVAWAAVHAGALDAGEALAAGELAVFADGDGEIVFRATEACGFVLGSAVRHPYPLVLGDYSVHTNAASLAKGETRIEELGRELRRAGRLG